MVTDIQEASLARRLAFNLTLLVVTLLGMLLMIEVILRFVILTPKPLLKPDTHYIYRFTPDTIYRNFHDDTQQTIIVNFNPLGWYGDLSEYQAQKTKPKRILAIGDSFLAQATVGGYDGMFTEQIENGNVDVITIGVGSYAFDNEYKVLEQEYETYNPDLILIGTFVNDLTETNRDNIFSIESGALIDNTPIHFSTLKMAVFNCMNILRTCKFLIDTLGRIEGGLLLNALAKRTGTADKDWDVSLDYIIYGLPRELFNGGLDHPALNKAVTKTDLILRKFKAFEVEHGTKIVFFLIPLREEVSQRKLVEFKDRYAISSPQFDIDRPYYLIRNLLQKNDPSYIDTLEAFRSEDDNNSFYFEQDGHWNKAGHTKASELLHDYLIEIGFTTIPAEEVDNR